MIGRQGVLVSVMAVLVVGGVLGADALAPPPASVPSPRVALAAGDPVGGGFVCGVGEATTDARLTVITARPPGGTGSPAQVELARLHEGSVEVRALPPIFPVSAARVETVPGDAPLTATRLTWRDAPATAWREWRTEGADDLPDATVAGACAAPSSPIWYVPGMSTEGGNEARLRLSNPFTSAATVRVGFLTPEGAAEPLILRNLTVPAGSVREIVVNETLPERADLAAIVEVASGRMSVEGIQIARSAIGGIDGASLLQAAPEPAEEWTVPWISDGARSSSWLWIANPGPRTATVELTLHTADGGDFPVGLAEVSVPPGELRRVDMTGTFPQEQRTAAVTARSNGAPIVVSAGTILTSEDPSRTGIAVQLGAAAPDRSWVVSGNAAQDRNEQLHLVNPTGVDAVVDIALFNGVVSLEPAALQGLEIAAGATRILDLGEQLDRRSRWSVFVTASSGEIVVGRLGRGVDEDAPLRLVATPGIPSAAWSAKGVGLAAVERPGLVRELRTDTGVRATGGPSGGADLEVEPGADPEAEPGAEPGE